jgi:CsoR family transcriptional regulator, copper-sensing transcriptional repressor
MHNTNKKKRTVNRIKILEGQMRGLEKMVMQDTYCIDVLTQSLAIKKSIESLNRLILENHLNTCVSNAMKNGNSKKAIAEVMHVFKKNT